MNRPSVTLNTSPNKNPTGSRATMSTKASQKSSKMSAKLSPPNIFKNFNTGMDPVREVVMQEKLQRMFEKMFMARANAPKPEKEKEIRPELSTRRDLAQPPDPTFPRSPYVIPSKIFKLKKGKQRRFDQCKWDNLSLPKPFDASTIGRKVDVPSPEVSLTKLKVFPKKPSITIHQMPEAPTPSKLELRKPKSGIFINETTAAPPKSDLDSFDLVFAKQPRPKRPDDEDEEELEHGKKKRRKKGDKPHDQADSGASLEHKSESKKTGERDLEQSEIDKIMREAEMLEKGEAEGEAEDFLPEICLTKMFRRKVSEVSKATSLDSRELAGFPVYEDEDLESQPMMTKIIQKFRRDSEAERYKPPPRKVKHGTFESHSFTKLGQPTLKEFYFGLVMGTINQSDEHFPETSRGAQGICMSVAAYCYSIILHPNKWSEFTIDDILEVGNRLYQDSVGNLHMHEDKKELLYGELYKYCYIDKKKFRYQVYEPEIVGLVCSADKKVYNLTKGLKLFYQRNQAGILQTVGTSIVIWKEKHFYVFDARGRSKDLVPDEKTGKALLANFYDIPDIVTVLLEYSKLGNWPFTISKLSVYKVLDKDEAEEDASKENLRERSDYNILNDATAVIQGSFDLADLCFDFSRNKQSIAMAAVCLVYSRITPPSAWHSKTVDKIMIIGNQLYLELVESENVLEMELERLPAVFTVGPYAVEIQILSNLVTEIMFRKSICMFEKHLEKFFESNTMAIVVIGKYVLAVWKQRNMYYCFDPYSRNNEALKCRNGTACVSMNNNLETLMQTIRTNFDNRDDIFHIHALKVLKIHRDPTQFDVFPKNMVMDDFHPETFKEYKMKKSKRKATEKKVATDFTETAVKKLLPWDFPAPSVIEIGSAVGSLGPDEIPPMVQRFRSRAVLKAMMDPEKEKDHVIDLDSPSLSDTQIYPERPTPTKHEGINMDAWELTQEELEMQGGDEEGGWEGDDEDARLESYMAMSQYAQVHEGSLDSYHRKISAEINTDITVGFLPIPRDVLPPTNMRWKQKMKKDRELARKRELLMAEGFAMEPEVTQSLELSKPTNFINLPDNTQLIRGTINISEFGKDVDFMAPFVCMMAGAVSQKYSLPTWSTEIVDYTLRSGAKLYKLSKVRYDQVPILEVPKVSLGRSDYSILVQYLYDTIMKHHILESVLDKVLFMVHQCGLVVTPSYACAVFLKNHLFYMYDPFGCNEVGLGEGPSNEGVACFARFKNIHDLATRIMYNKAKRDSAEEYEFTRFVVSSCVAKFIPPEPEKIYKQKKFGKGGAKDKLMEKGEEYGASDLEEPQEEEKSPEPENRVGYQLCDGVLTLQGSTALTGRSELNFEELKEDHFVCLCVCLLALDYPVLQWDTKRVNYVIEQGKHIFGHAENLEISDKRIIRNILIYKHFFDVIVTRIKIPDWRKNKCLEIGLNTVMEKRNYVILQFPNCCYVLYKHNDWYHVFDPYSCLPNGKMDKSESGYAGWTLFKGLDKTKKRIRSQIIPKGETYSFYVFQVTSVKKASKKVILNQRLLEYEFDEPTKKEHYPGHSFHEKDYWLVRDPLPWSHRKATTAKGKPRGKKENMWNDWDIEYPKDLFSLVGTKHQTSLEFDERVRGKQTLANLIIAIGMVEIYNLSEWNTAIMDSLLTYGNAYFMECIKTIRDEDHEFALDDLKTDCTIYPYTFEMLVTPVVEGTMFLMRAQQFNLYKAMRYFFDNRESRYGIICACKDENVERRFLAFGKVQDNEYFMYDCQGFGPPMFLDNQGVAYILRCRTMKRLLYLMVMTLRGGDFFIFDVNVDNFVPLI